MLETFRLQSEGAYRESTEADPRYAAQLVVTASSGGVAGRGERFDYLMSALVPFLITTVAFVIGAVEQPGLTGVNVPITTSVLVMN